MPNANAQGHLSLSCTLAAVAAAPTKTAGMGKAIHGFVPHATPIAAPRPAFSIRI